MPIHSSLAGWVLETRNTAYALGLNHAGLLTHRYWGARLQFFDDYPEPIFLLLLATLIVPFELIFVPLYLMLAKWGWINTYWALIIPSLGNPFAIFMFRQFVLSVPKELEEAMFMDGTGYLRIFWSLMLPFSGPPTVSIFIPTWLSGVACSSRCSSPPKRTCGLFRSV